MIWTNGYIKFKDTPIQLFDNDGNPIEEIEDFWSDYIECNYEENTSLTSKSSENSDFTSQSFTIRIKLQPVKERVKIYNKDYNCLGEYVVQNCIHFKYIDETHILCKI